MQYSMFDELSFSLRLAELERLDLRYLREAETLLARRGVRESIAATLVRLGVSLDHQAGERALAASAGRVVS